MDSSYSALFAPSFNWPEFYSLSSLSPAPVIGLEHPGYHAVLQIGSVIIIGRLNAGHRDYLKAAVKKGTDDVRRFSDTQIFP
jgi:hypothetical protein